MNNFLKGSQEEELQDHVLDILKVHDRIFVQLAADLRISNLTDGAQQILHANIFQPIQETLSEHTCSTLRICQKERRGAQLRETIDGIDYRLEVRPAGEGLLLYFASQRELEGEIALAQLTASRITTYISNILSLTENPEGNREDMQARVRKNALRILRTQRHAALLESMQQEYDPELQVYDAAELCRALVRSLPETRVQVQLEAPEHCLAVFDWGLMQLAVGNLLANAIQAAEHTVTLSLGQYGRRITFAVSDDGCGLTATELDLMCNGWRHLHPEEKWRTLTAESRRWGIGLPLAEYIAGLHYGVLLAHRKEPKGACILLSIPDDLEALHLLRQDDLRADTGIDPLEIEFSVL